LLARQVSSSATMYVQYLSPVNSIHTGRRTAVRFEHATANLLYDFGGIALPIPYRVLCMQTLL